MPDPDFSKWVGKSQTLTDTLNPKQAQLMQATLDRDQSAKQGDALPPLWNWIYFLTTVPLSETDRDGHPAKGGFLPPVPLPRRMWAGGRFTFEKPALLGETITKTSTIKNVTEKSGKSGALCFVTIEHDYTSQDGERYFVEEQDIVYREDPGPGAAKPAPINPPGGSADSETITPSTVQLFRYSALTFNSHRIHYDRDYCKDVEGYPGVVFHGPLTATLLADYAHRKSGGKAFKTFDFRAVAPLFDTQPFTVHDDGKGTVWAQTPEGGLAMKASVTFS